MKASKRKPPSWSATPSSSRSISSTQPQTSRLAIASLVLGVLSIFVWLLAGIPGIVCGVIGLIHIRRSETGGPGSRLTGRSLAITGIVLSSITMLSVPVMIVLLMPTTRFARDAAATNDIRHVSVAMLQAESRMGALPAAIIDAEHNQTLSWRVAMLPFLGDEAAAIFREFHLDEPWDSDHNKSLIGRMPAVYASFGTDSSEGVTDIVLPVGPGAAMSDPEELTASDKAGKSRIIGVRLDTIRDGDGTSVTVLMMAIPGLRIPWTQPVDLIDDPAKTFATMHEAGIARVIVSMADGAVRRLRTDLPPDQVRALFSRDGRDFVTDASLND